MGETPPRPEVAPHPTEKTQPRLKAVLSAIREAESFEDLHQRLARLEATP